MTFVCTECGCKDQHISRSQKKEVHAYCTTHEGWACFRHLSIYACDIHDAFAFENTKTGEYICPWCTES